MEGEHHPVTPTIMDPSMRPAGGGVAGIGGRPGPSKSEGFSPKKFITENKGLMIGLAVVIVVIFLIIIYMWWSKRNSPQGDGKTAKPDARVGSTRAQPPLGEGVDKEELARIRDARRRGEVPGAKPGGPPGEPPSEPPSEPPGGSHVTLPPAPAPAPAPVDGGHRDAPPSAPASSKDGDVQSLIDSLKEEVTTTAP